MKKYLFMAALAVVAAFTFTACGDDDDDNKKSSFNKTSNYDDAFTFDRSDDTESFESLGDGKVKLTPSGMDQIREYLESGKYDDAIVEMIKLFGVSGEKEILAVLADGVVAPEGKGKSLPYEEAIEKLSLLMESKPFGAPAKYKMEVAPIQLPFQFITGTYKKVDNKIVAFNDMKFTPNANLLKVIVKDKTKELKGKLLKSIPETPVTIKAFRAWKVDKIIADVTKPNKDVVGKKWNTSNLYTIAKDLVDNNGVNISDKDMADIKALGNLNKIVLDMSGNFTLYFDNKLYKGNMLSFKSVKEDLASFAYMFIDEEMKNAFIEAAGNAEFSFSKDNVLTIKSTYENAEKEVYDVECNFYLKPAN